MRSRLPQPIFRSRPSPTSILFSKLDLQEGAVNPDTIHLALSLTLLFPLLQLLITPRAQTANADKGKRRSKEIQGVGPTGTRIHSGWEEVAPSPLLAAIVRKSTCMYKQQRSLYGYPQPTFLHTFQ